MTPVAIYSGEPAKGWLPWGALAPVLLIFFVVLPVLATDGLMMQMHWVTAKGDPIGIQGLMAFLLLPFALTGLAVLAWVRFIERRPLATIGLGGTGGGRAFLRGLAIGMATIAGVVAAIWLCGGYRAEGFGLALGSAMALANTGLLLLCFVIQASVEEIIFRGWLMSVLARKFNVIVAVVLSSLVFTLLHFSPKLPWLAIVSVFLFSVFASCWALQANNIWSVMGWHVGWNWLLSVGFELPVTGIDTGLPALLVKLDPIGPVALTGGAQGPEGSFLCVVFFVLGLSALLAHRARRDRPRDPA